MWCFRQLRAQDRRAMMKDVRHLQSHSTEHQEYLFDPKEENEMDRQQRHEGRLMAERQKCRGEHKHDCRRNGLM